ncbi:PTS system mannose/fructose/N-acetylgalactosamine-transporter subunit IIB [Furfurilactobacillus siliginis]|uniref:PTS fructose transporter subunit IIB n=1 Tax=Furfurilactobacillus siliginis TaxID=348151 RepID=A0A0R2LAJ3_9LACO|nr:PTS sugar transporter subunit IIB [Furfurilactobacillus siliginis]KRN95751.1 phosphotransferase system, mannose fructose-specific component IIA [Furfurilactobacillus siliginis]GEK27987.1 PTS fructose transporter subunit IIB [Furfurilactobacillus siliginis]
MPMTIRLARIDSRLLHGQVATVWTQAVKPNRIIVVSDGVAQDPLRKNLVTQAAPPGVMVNVIAVNQLAAVMNDEQFADVEAFLLFETPKDVLRVIDAGVTLPSVNVGSLSFTDGKKMITDAVAVDQADAETFTKLHDSGVALEVRKVPSDRQQDLMTLLADNGF